MWFTKFFTEEVKRRYLAAYFNRKVKPMLLHILA